MVDKEKFSLEMTGVDASVQNGVAASPNKSTAQMSWCILHNTNLGPEYCSYALIHAAYIKQQTAPLDN